MLPMLQRAHAARSARRPPRRKPQVYVSRRDICFIYLPDRASHSTVYMLKNVQAAIVHTGPLVIRGEIHLGVDATLATFVDDLPGNFFPVTNAELFTQATARAAAAQGRFDLP